MLFRLLLFSALLQLGTHLGIAYQAHFSPTEDLDQIVTQELLQAQSSIDMAMYNLSSTEVREVLLQALGRGVQLRLLVHDAMEPQRKQYLTPLIDAGAQVRWVTEILHHKFVILDDQLLINSSANLSGSRLVKSYDENLVLCRDCVDKLWQFQNEFVALFEASNLVSNVNDVGPTGFPTSLHRNYVQSLFTSSNFSARYDSNRMRISFTRDPLTKDRGRVELALAYAIASAKEEILIATAHFRSKPLFDALKAAVQRGVRVVVVSDRQEYVSEAKAKRQKQELRKCAESRASWECFRKGEYFARMLEDLGAQVYFKFYGFRWFFPLAPQMHHKYMIIDRERLYSGSYNWSYNAEFESFENVAIFESKNAAGIVESYLRNFMEVLKYGGGPTAFEAFRSELFSQTPLPLHFPPITLSTEQVDELLAEAKAHCPQLYSLAPSKRTCTEN